MFANDVVLITLCNVCYAYDAPSLQEKIVSSSGDEKRLRNILAQPAYRAPSFSSLTPVRVNKVEPLDRNLEDWKMSWFRMMNEDE